MILLFQPIPKPAVNHLPLVANLTETEKVRPFFLQVSEEEKAAHHPGVVGVFFRPTVVFAKDCSSRLFFLHARHARHDSLPISIFSLAQIANSYGVHNL